MTKKHYIVPLIYSKLKTVPPIEETIELPDGCIGIVFVFSSKKKALRFVGKKVDLIETQIKTWLKPKDQ